MGVSNHVVFFSLHEWSVGRSLTIIVHEDFVFGMFVHSKGDGFIFEVIHLVKMSQKCVSNEDKGSSSSLKLVRVNGELASFSFGLMEVKSRAHFESLTTDRESNRLEFRCNISTWGHHLAEVIISDAIQIMNIFSPLLLKVLEHLVWDTNVRASSINNSSVSMLSSSTRGWILSILDSLTFESPLFDWLWPIWSVSGSWHFMEAFSSSNDLLRDHSTESGIRLVIHRWTGNTERDNSSINKTVVLEVPDIVQVSSLGIRMHSKTQNTISVIESDSLIKG